jgi:hypothetical protein
MNSSGYDEIKKFPKENGTQFNRKIHAHDRLESARVPFDQGSRKGRKFNAGYYITEIFDPLSHYSNGAQLKQRETGENCWCMRAMCARILPSYQLNILARIE